LTQLNLSDKGGRRVGRWSFVPGKPRVLGFDTGALFRDDCLLHIQHLQTEVDADMERIKQGDKELRAIND